MKKIYTSIDIGSDTIKFIVGEYFKEKVNILFAHEEKSKGIRKGLIVDPNLAINSIKDGIKKYGDDKEIIVFMHYPPISNTNKKSEFLKILKQYDIKRCYYGHLHGASIADAVEGEVEGIEFKLISADGLDFKLLKI